MISKFTLEGLCCANCAAKMEDRINRIPGCREATIAFMTKKLVLDTDDDLTEQVVAEAERIVKKIEPDIVFVRR